MSPSWNEWPPECLSLEGVGSGKQLWITFRSISGEQIEQLQPSEEKSRVLQGPGFCRKEESAAQEDGCRGDLSIHCAASAGRHSLHHHGAQRWKDVTVSKQFTVMVRGWTTNSKPQDDWSTGETGQVTGTLEAR